MVRIGAAIAALVFAGLLVLTVLPATRGPDVIVPTSGVTHAGPIDNVPASPDARATLAARAGLLQEYRSAPFDESATAAADSAGRRLEGTTGVQGGAGEVRRWLDRESQDFGVLRNRANVTGIAPVYADRRGNVLIQSGGRDWRRTHEDEITFGGGWLIFGGLLLMAVFLALRGRVRTKRPYTGRRVMRFSPFERMIHWLVATSFTMLGLTGLVLIYGQYLIKPWLGAGAYSSLAEASIYVHIAFSLAFVLGLVVMLVVWARENVWRKYDFTWLKMGGGIAWEAGQAPPAERFNAGQKLWYWFAIFAGLLMLASGVTLMFPFFWFDVQGMQWTMTVHAALGLILIVGSFAHVYIGTVGMHGAIDAMWSGEVDTTWAREHHCLWARDIGIEPPESEAVRRSGDEERHGRHAIAE